METALHIMVVSRMRERSVVRQHLKVARISPQKKSLKREGKQFSRARRDVDVERGQLQEMAVTEGRAIALAIRSGICQIPCLSFMPAFWCVTACFDTITISTSTRRQASQLYVYERMPSHGIGHGLQGMLLVHVRSPYSQYA